MKQVFFLLVIPAMFGCNGKAGQANVLQNRIDSLRSQLEQSYKPGFGDFMGSIQVHHNKLWLRDKTKIGNWPTLKYMKYRKLLTTFRNIKPIERKAK